MFSLGWGPSFDGEVLALPSPSLADEGPAPPPPPCADDDA